MAKPKSSNTYFVLSLIIFFGGLIVFLYNYREEIHIPQITLEPFRHSGGNVECLVVTTIRDKSLRLSFSIPAKDKRHRERLIRELPRIKHELLMSADDPEMVSYFEKRDFVSIRKKVIELVNKHLEKPVDTVYFDSFFYN